MGLSILDPRRHNRFDSEASVVELRIVVMVESICLGVPLESRKIAPNRKRISNHCWETS